MQTYNLMIPDESNNNNKNPLNNQKTYTNYTIKGKIYNKKMQTFNNNLISYQQRQHLFLNKKNNKNVLIFLDKNCIINNKYIIEDIYYYNTYIVLLLKNL